MLPTPPAPPAPPPAPNPPYPPPKVCASCGLGAPQRKQRGLDAKTFPHPWGHSQSPGRAVFPALAPANAPGGPRSRPALPGGAPLPAMAEPAGVPIPAPIPAGVPAPPVPGDAAAVEVLAVARRGDAGHDAPGVTNPGVYPPSRAVGGRRAAGVV